MARVVAGTLGVTATELTAGLRRRSLPCCMLAPGHFARSEGRGRRVSGFLGQGAREVVQRADSIMSMLSHEPSDFGLGALKLGIGLVLCILRLVCLLSVPGVFALLLYKSRD